jgi:E3 ubiquitin-protein ligase RNF5
VFFFSWKCLAQWLNLQSRNPTCPVCKAGSGNDKVIPVYGRGEEEADPR